MRKTSEKLYGLYGIIIVVVGIFGARLGGIFGIVWLTGSNFSTVWLAIAIPSILIGILAMVLEALANRSDKKSKPERDRTQREINCKFYGEEYAKYHRK